MGIVEPLHGSGWIERGESLTIDERGYRDLKSGFAEYGFSILRGHFSPSALNAFEQTMLDLYVIQARKIGEYRAKVDVILGNLQLDRFHKLSAIMEMMEAGDKEALYQVQKFFGSSNDLRKLFDARFMGLCCDLLGSNECETLIDGPALFVNRPNTDRLLYKWHSEAHYYPKRRRFLNIWFPLFGSKDASNGAMSIKPKSHVKHWDFAEYRGYDKDSENKANHFVQYEIPEGHLEQYREKVCTTDRGDLVIFDRNLAHRSNANQGNSYSFACVARVWTPRDDLTLSGSLAATPYGNDVGRSNLVVA